MDLVVRTPHGVADVSVLAHGPAATLADLVRLVTGQAVPAVAEVDGRAIDTAVPIAASALLAGSVIDTTSPERPPPGAVVELLQLAGRGAGTVRPLTPGRYRVGPGRRLVADELSSAAVEITALELTVGDDGSIEARPGYAGAVRINGRRITEAEIWAGGMLAVEGRVFAVESPGPALPGRRLPEPDSGGLVAFNRPPRAGDDGPRRLVVDAVRDAAGTRRSLWRQRAGDLAAFTIPVGLAGDPLGPITVDLAAERGVALIGSEEFVTGLARTLLVEACTLHGPADLDVSIATSAEGLGRWDWAKWLPHVRDGGPPRIIVGESQLHEWVTGLESSAADAAGQLSPTPLALLVVDDPGLWTRRESPLLPLLSSHPAALRILTLVERAEQAPAACTATIAESEGGTAHLIVADRGVDVTDIVPALAGDGLAADVARHLAPLDDTERPTTRAFSTSEPAPTSVRELIAPLPADIDAPVAAWDTPDPPAAIRVPVGLSSGEPLTVGLDADWNVLVAGTRTDLAGDVALTMVFGIAAQLPPDAFSVVHVATAAGAQMDALDDLPHFAGRFGDPGAAAATRLILRLAHVVGGMDPAEERVVVVVDNARRTELASPGLADGLIELAEALPALQVVMTTDARHDDVDRRRLAQYAVQIDVDEQAGQRRGSLRVDSERVHVPFVPYTPPDVSPGPGGLVVRPLVYGRAPTSLERRLDLLARHDAGAQERDDFVRLASLLTDAAEGLDRPPPAPLVPEPLPDRYRSEALLAERPGDAIPLGMVDLPERGGTVPLWWQPGEQGSMLLLGSPRSGVDGALSTLLLGAASRFSADDLHIYSIDPLGRRRVAAGLLPHTGAATTPDRVDEVAQIVGWLAAESERRAAGGTPVVTGAPSLLLLVHDLGQLRRHLTGRDDVVRDLETIADAAELGINLVATAWQVEDAGRLLDAVADRLVGAMAEPADYERLGIVDPTAIEGQLGRCWSTTVDRLVQLAAPPGSLVGEIGELETEEATARPPARPTAVEQVVRP